MDDSVARLEDRLNEVEIKLAFTEDLVDRLNEVIVRQQSQIDALIRELLQLRDQLPGPDGPGVRNLRDERPPHY